MRDRIEPALRLLCLGLGGLLLLLLALRVPHLFALRGVKIPALPTLAAAETKTNAPSEKKTPGVAATSTNQTARTNQSATAVAGPGKTNSPDSTKVAETNLTAQASVAHRQTSLTGPTNSIAAVISSNSGLAIATNRTATNTLSARTTNSPVPSVSSVSSSTNTSKSSSNLLAGAAQGSMPRQPGGQPPGGRPGGPGAKPIELAPAAQAEVDRVVDSEILGPVFHPMPLALLGIAGDMAFLRAPSGQSGAVKQGDSLGAIKLVRIGINRVLVEEDGQKKELMIFEGAGGESLMPK